jgi:hypothetical protein
MPSGSSAAFGVRITATASRCSDAIAFTVSACSATLRSVPWNSKKRVSATGWLIFE